MKRYIFCVFFIVIGLACANGQSSIAGSHIQILPMSPMDLIKYLPPIPAGWTLVCSRGDNNFNNRWVISRVWRDFKLDVVPPAPGASTTSVSEPALMRVRITDSGYYNDYRGEVKGGAASGNVTFPIINGIPARQYIQDPKTISITLLAKERFLIEIEVKNLTEFNLKPLLNSFDFSGLLSVSDKGATALTNPIVLSRVDEMNPEGTRSYPYFWSGGGRGHK